LEGPSGEFPSSTVVVLDEQDVITVDDHGNQVR
jgi:hypothetical protein